MNTAVRYFTRSGNTKRLALAIATAAGCSAMPVSQELQEPVDLLFLGGSVYGFDIAPELADFIQKLSPQLVKKAALFGTAAVVASASPQMKKLLAGREIQVLDRDFHCRGSFIFMHSGRPNSADCAAAADFAKKLIDAEGK